MNGGFAMIRLIASDIDGTLLPRGARALSRRLFEQIRRLREKGILFCPVSGRQYSSQRRLFAPAADLLPFVCENGAVVFGPGSPGEVLGKTPMDRALAEALCRDIMALPGCDVLISGINTSYLCPRQTNIVHHMEFYVGNNIQLVSSPEEVPEDMVKVSAYCPRGAAAIEPELAPRWSVHFNAAIAGIPWLDFTLADKGTGLRQLCAALGIGLDEVVAFGDNYNDLPMLALVGQPYLMESSAPELHGRFPPCRQVEDVLEGL